jgi:predicted enzyme related to lactoylglutathione lyase
MATHGKICYLEIPASNVAQSASFYAKAFGWRMRTRGDGTQAFDDATGAVSGAFVVGRGASTTPGLLVYIMVDSVDETCRVVESNGGKIVQPIGADAPEITARFRDPGGNVIGLYQEPTKRPSAEE